MNSKTMVDILMTRVGPGGTELSNSDANYLVDVLRRDWAVRVLDAWRDMATLSRSWAVSYDGRRYVCQLGSGFRNEYGATPEEAREAGALSVWNGRELPESVRAEIG